MEKDAEAKDKENTSSSKDKSMLSFDDWVATLEDVQTKAKRTSRKRKLPGDDEGHKCKRGSAGAIADALMEMRALLDTKKRKREEEGTQESKKRCLFELQGAFMRLPAAAQKAILGSHGQGLLQRNSIEGMTSLDLQLPVPIEAMQFVAFYMWNLREVTLQPSPTLFGSFPAFDLSLLRPLWMLDGLTLSHCRFSGMDIFARQLHSLKRLKLHHCQAEYPQWVQQVAMIDSLEEVTLVRCSPMLTDVDLESLREGLSNLRKLTVGLHYQRLNFTCLSGMSRLEVLMLQNADFGQDTMRDCWDGLPCLRSLHLDACGPLNVITPLLAEIASVEEICFENSTVSDKVMAEVGFGRCRLSNLSFTNCEVGNKCWAIISKMSTLKSLAYSGELMDEPMDEPLKFLAQGDFSLHSLALEQCSLITYHGLEALISSHRKSLKFISIKRCKQICYGSFKELTKGLPCLEEALHVPFVQPTRDEAG